MLKIGVTGAPAAGKSTVCQILKENGAYIVDADVVVSNLLSSDRSLGEKVIELLGSEVLTNNSIDKEKVGCVVFSDPVKLKLLEDLLHPFIKKRIENEYNQAKLSGRYLLFVVEVPLLFEMGMEEDFNLILTIVADEAVARHRFKKRHFEERSRNQFSPSLKASKADFTVTNNADIKSLRSSIESILTHFKSF